MASKAFGCRMASLLKSEQVREAPARHLHRIAECGGLARRDQIHDVQCIPNIEASEPAPLELARMLLSPLPALLNYRQSLRLVLFLSHALLLSKSRAGG